MKVNQTKLWGYAVFSIVFFSIISCGDNQKPQDEKPEVLAPAQIVGINAAKSMYENYSNRRVPLIQKYEDSINRAIAETQEEAKPFDVARFIYYDYKTIKDYLAYIEQESEKAGVEISTLRFYFSNYQNEQYFPNSEEEIKHPRQNSVMLSPTIKKGKRDYLFYVAKGAEGQEAVLMNDDFGSIKGMGVINEETKKSYASMIPSLTKKSNANFIFQGGNSMTMNRGQGAPPYGNN